MKRMILKTAPLIFILLCLAGVSCVYAASGDAGQPGSFLNFGAGARALGMGKAYVGLADDATAVYWNPSCLSKIHSNELVILHAIMFEDTTYDFISFSYPTLNIGTFGLGVTYLRSTGFEGRTGNNEAIGSFDETNLAVFFSYGVKLFKNAGAGTSIKIINQAIGEFKGYAVGIDFGLWYAPFDFLGLGLMVENVLQPRMKLKDEEEVYPVGLKLGTNIKLADNKVNINIDAGKTGASGIKLKGGAEYRPYEYFAVRAGLDETEITGGLGVYYKEYGLEYALGSQSLGFSHRVSFSWTFGTFDIKVEAEPKVFSPFGTKKEVEIRLLGSGRFGLKNWDVIIKNKKGVIVRRFSGEGQPADGLKWDGKNENGNYVADGKYDIELKLIDKVGEIRTAFDTVNMETSVPETNIQMEIR